MRAADGIASNVVALKGQVCNRQLQQLTTKAGLP
jgi:hypothetical protein